MATAVALSDRIAVTVTEFAALLGVDRRKVAALIDAGLPTFTPPGSTRPLVLRAAAIEWLERKAAA